MDMGQIFIKGFTVDAGMDGSFIVRQNEKFWGFSDIDDMLAWFAKNRNALAVERCRNEQIKAAAQMKVEKAGVYSGARSVSDDWKSQ